MSPEGMGASMAVEGATTARIFEAYVEKVLVPTPRTGRVVVMDDLGAHRPKRIGGVDQAARMRAAVLAGLLSGLRPDRRGVRQGRAPLSQGRGQDESGFGKCDRSSALGGKRPRRPALFRACPIPHYGSPTVKRAVTGHLVRTLADQAGGRRLSPGGLVPQETFDLRRCARLGT
jgi:hypothetical protein